MYKLISILLISLCICFQSVGQITIDNKLIFNSTDSVQRQILSISKSTTLHSAARTSDVQFSSYNIPNSAITVIGDTIHLNISPNPGSIDSFLIVEFTVMPYFPNNFHIKINNHLAYPLLSHAGEILFPFQVDSGTVIQAMFSGQEFRVIQKYSKGCPQGFVYVNKNYCIEINERTADFFWPANEVCNSLNAKLCTWAEWYYACQLSGLGLQNMLGNYEFIDDASDHSQTIATVGGGNCTNMLDVTIAIVNNLYKKNYRCCYSRK